jgi:hypothetical protein
MIEGGLTVLDFAVLSTKLHREEWSMYNAAARPARHRRRLKSENPASLNLLPESEAMRGVP